MSPVTVPSSYNVDPVTVSPVSALFSNPPCWPHGPLHYPTSVSTVNECHIQTVLSVRTPRLHCKIRGVNSDVLVPLKSHCSQRADSRHVSSPPTLESQADFVKQKGLGFIHMNVRSLTAKIDYINVWALQTNADIFVFSETWLSDQVSDDEIALDGYNVFRSDRCKPTKGGGVAIFVKKMFFCLCC